MPSQRPSATPGIAPCLALGLALVAGAARGGPAPPPPTAPAAAEAEPELDPPLEPVEETVGDMPPASLFGRDCMDFGASLYNALAKDAGTVLFSPYQVQMALLLLATSADPNARARFVTTVQPHQTEELLRELFAHLHGDLRSSAPEARVSIGGAWWPGPGAASHGAWLEERLASADVVPTSHPSPLGRGPGLAAMNGWVQEATGGLLRAAVRTEDLPASLTAALSLGLSLDSRWARDRSKKARARVDSRAVKANGRSRTVTTLTRKDRMYYAENADFKIAEIGFRTEHTSFVMFVPKDPNNRLDTLPAGPALRRMLGDLAPTSLQVGVPLFEARTTQSLRHVLSRLRLDGLFEADTFGPEGGARLGLADVLHGAAMQVDKDGARAGAATVLSLRAGTSPPPKGGPAPPTSRGKLPFAFIVRDTNWNVPLWMGRIDSL
jgi:serine protease inhibitor